MRPPAWLRHPARLPLRAVIPLSLLAFAALVGLWSHTYHTRVALAEVRSYHEQRLVRRLTRLQDTLEYLLRHDDLAQAQAEIAALGTDTTIQTALLLDEHDRVLGSLRRADLGQDAATVLPPPAGGEAGRQHALEQARLRLSGQTQLAPDGRSLTGLYPVRLGGRGGQARAERVGVLYLRLDLAAPLAAARRTVERQTLEFGALMLLGAALLWAFLHFSISRRVARLVAVAEALARGDTTARAGLAGHHELAVIGRAFDAMAGRIADREQRLRERERELRAALAAARMGTWHWEPSGNVVAWSGEVEALFGLAPGQFDGRFESYARAIHPEDRERVLGAIRTALETGRGYEIEHRIVAADGGVRWIAARGDVVPGAGGITRAMTGLVWDVTAAKQAEAALHEARERAEVTLHSIGDGVITTDGSGRIDYINPVAERLTGWTLAEAAGRPLGEIFRIVNEYARTAAEDPVARCLREGAIVGLANHTVLIARDGRELAIEDSAAPIRDREGRIIGVVMVFHDVTASRELASQLSWQASHDSLTGLVNRREFEIRLGRAIAAAHAGQARHALLYIDLDQFKIVNDTCGHGAGDELLRQLAALMQARMRASDTVARLGGDEFGVLLEHCPLEQAMRIADTLRTITASFRFHWQQHRFDVSASIGVVDIHHDCGDLAAVMAAADMACYAAKESGRNRIHVYRESDAELRQRHSEMLWVAQLKAALAENRFELHGQPIVPAAGDGEPMCEILLRLRGADGTLVAPAEFLPAAERYNLMPALDRWVIGTLFARHGARLRAGGRVSINLSGASLGDDGFLEFVREALAADAIPPERVCFEITETAAIANLARAVQLIETLRGLGCRFALDDFGAGLSSFGYLKNLPVDYLKIDGTLVRRMADDPIDRAMVEAIHGIGRVMGLRTIAEFVESEAIRERLAAVGVDFLQGYGIARPAPLESRCLRPGP